MPDPEGHRRGPPPPPPQAFQERPAPAGGTPRADAESIPALAAARTLEETLLALIDAEIRTQPDAAAAADLWVRRALVARDLLGDEAAADASLQAAGDHHPLARRLRLGLAVSRSDAGALRVALDAALAAKDSDVATLVTLAEALLYRADAAEDAARALRAALERAPADPAVRDFAALVLVIAGDYSSAFAALTGAPEEDACAHLEAAQLATDRLGERSAAGRELARARKALDEKSPAFRYWVERILETAEPNDEVVTDALQAKLAIARADGESGSERTAIVLQLAQHLEQRGDLDGAAGLYDEAAHNAEDAGVQRRVSLEGRRRLAGRRNDRPGLTTILRELVGLHGGAAFDRARERRLAELWVAGEGRARAIESAYAKLQQGDPTDDAVLRALERAYLAGGRPVEHLAALERSADVRPALRASRLRRAAALAEAKCRDIEAAIRLQDLAGGGDLAALSERARLLRERKDQTALAAVYRLLAETESDDRNAAAYLTVAGLVAASVGDIKAAEESLRAAAKYEPTDAVSRMARVWLLRRGGRPQELGEALADLSSHLRAPSSRLAVQRELARVQMERLGDRSAAKRALEQAHDLAPDDPEPVLVLASLCLQDEPARALDLYVAAAEKTADDEEAAALLLQAGEIARERLHDANRAAAALEAALERDPASRPALDALAALYRGQSRSADLVRVLRRAIVLEQDPAKRVPLQVDVAQELEKRSASPDEILAAYRQALEADPGNVPALAGAERICRSGERWEELRDVFQPAPPTRENLRVLSDALERLGDKPALVAARRAALDLLTDPAEIVRASLDLAALVESVDYVDEAFTLLRRALDVDPTSLEPAERLRELATRHERPTELHHALRALLGRQVDPALRLPLCLEIGNLCRGPLERPVEAATWFETALGVDPTCEAALVALRDLYVAGQQQPQLVRVLGLHAQAAADPTERAERFLKLGESHEAAGELQEAAGAYQQAFAARPENRTAFTSVERACFRLERWDDVLALYDQALNMVESNPRAYRAADLHARKAQLYLQYLGRPREAVAAYGRVLTLDPNDDRILEKVEAICEQLEDWAVLLDVYRSRAAVVEDEARRLDTLQRAAEVARTKAKDDAAAAALFSDILSMRPNDPTALDWLEKHHERAKQHGKLVEILDARLGSAAPAEAVALHQRLALAHEEGLRDPEQAVSHLRKILEIEPEHREALEHLGRIYEATERWLEFIDVTRKQIRVTTDRGLKALLYFKCGSVMEAKFGKDDDAIRYYDAAIKTSATCLPAVHGLRDLYLRRKDYAAVVRTLELEAKLWQDEKERAGVLARLGTLHMNELGDPARALRYFEQALRVDPESLPANKALFELHFSRGNYAAAAPVGQRLASKAMREGDPKERSAFYVKRAVVARETGDAKGAAESLVIALEIWSENLEALDGLVALYRAHPDAYDFTTTFRELEKIYQRRGLPGASARVVIATGLEREHAADLEGAERAYHQAMELVPDDRTIADALVDLKVRERRFADALGVLDAQLAQEQSDQGKIRILLRKSEILDEGLMDPGRAATVLEEVLGVAPNHLGALYRLAQELFLLGRFDEALGACDRLIEQAAAPGQTAPPEELARYYYYRGRCAEAQGDSKAAAQAYRRAAEWDEAYGPPALALARRAASNGDVEGAQAQLRRAAEQAAARGATNETLRLRRGLAALQSETANLDGAIATYREIVLAAADSADDRVTLAELCSRNPATVGEALIQLQESLRLDLRHGPSLRLLAGLYERLGQPERTVRALVILDTLGYASEHDRNRLKALRSARPLRSSAWTEPTRGRIHPADLRGPLTDLFLAVRSELSVLYPLPFPGQNRAPAQGGEAPLFNTLAHEVLRQLGVDAELLLGDGVPGMACAVDLPRPSLVVDRMVLQLPEPELRFVLGRTLEPLKGGFSFALRLGPRERQELGLLLQALCQPESSRDPSSAEFVRALPRKIARNIERFVGMQLPADATEQWFEALQVTADRAGLVTSDDIGAALRVLAWLGGEELAVTDDGAVALGAVPGGIGLVRYYLGDDYNAVRELLSEASARKPATR